MPPAHQNYAIAGFLVLSLFGNCSFANSDHSLFEEIIKQTVQDGWVNYPAIAENSDFDRYLIELSQPLSTEARDEKLAFWINAYNAFAIRGILDGRSPSTFFGRIGYFKTAKYTIGGQTINLYDLERKIIIPFNEPRIHFAINCASASCPQLASHVYTAENLDQQLEIAARMFINDPARNQFDRQNKIAYLSKIFDWFETDFRQHSGSVQKYISRFITDANVAKELADERYKIKYLPYDWNLNGVPPAG